MNSISFLIVFVSINNEEIYNFCQRNAHDMKRRTLIYFCASFRLHKMHEISNRNVSDV